MERKKEHADFQNEYRRSSNFGKAEEKEDLEIKGDGKLKMEKDEKMKEKAEKKKIEKTLNKIDLEEE